MAPSLASALGASEASLLEMTSAYSTFPNKGVRVEPHLIRKVYSRDGTLLEEWEKKSSKVMSEYVALTMVDLMRGVVNLPFGTAAGAQAAGQPLAGKTGTVNDHTDVWFIGYTPTYVTGVWMGNPTKKENLGNYMTGGHGALPFFNAFMNPFMKDKPKESFTEPPPIPPEIKTLIERNKREELEKLEKAELAGIKTGASSSKDSKVSGSTDSDTGAAAGASDASPPAGDLPRPAPSDEKPVVIKPPVERPPVRNPEPPPAAGPEGTKRKGKKGDG
jgi:penicillin-binding protein 1A